MRTLLRISVGLAAVGLVLLFPVSASASTDGLLLHLPFEDNAQDISGNGYHGIVTGALLGPDRFGRSDAAFYFDGNDYIDSSFDFNGAVADFSFSYWVRFNSIANSEKVFHIQEDVSGYPEINNDFRSGELIFYLRGLSGPTLPGESYFSVTVELDRWYHVVSTFDISTQRKKGYIDGGLSLDEVSDFQIDRLPESPLRVGGRRGGSNFLDGVVDDFRIYDRVLSADEVSELFHEEPPAVIPLPGALPLFGSALAGLTLLQGPRRRYERTPKTTFYVTHGWGR